MATIGEGYAWAALEFASDGELIQLRLARENTPDACAMPASRETFARGWGSARSRSAMPDWASS
jgi:hypothetical protein